MNRTISVRRLVLALALVTAWVPAAMQAVPGARAAAADAPALEAVPVAGEGVEVPSAVALRGA